ncbi:MAG: type II toxin-antitoxin system VapC family toxin [Blastocatellia bacterium]
MRWFLDSSALVKRYVREPGSSWLRTELARNELLIAQITPVELIAAICKRYRAGDISRFTFYQSRYHLLQDFKAQAYKVIALNDRIIKAAQDLTCAQNLRAYDAVQLATAFYAINALKSPRFIFITADARLEAAAIAEGLQTDNPLNH